MRSIVELDIDAPLARVAALYANPELSTEWMDDIERYEPISGEPGAPGSRYRLVPRKGSMLFVATVIARDLPNEARIRLDAPQVTVFVTGRLAALSPDRTRLVSEEVFHFKGLLHGVLGFLARGAIKKAHRRHMEAFKHFVERSA